MTKEAQELHELVTSTYEALEEDRTKSESRRTEPQSDGADERRRSNDPGPIAHETPLDRLWYGIVLNLRESKLARALFAALVLLFMLLALAFIPGFFGEDDTAPAPGDGGADATELDDTSAAVGEQDDADQPVAESAAADEAAPLSGTWTMYWRNSEGSEAPGFTLRFIGVDTGTVEVLNDDTETDTSFTLDESATPQLELGFTRAFFGDSYPAEGWPEKSTFVGVQGADGTFTGTWSREGWECNPDTGCTHTSDWTSFDAWLVQEP